MGNLELGSVDPASLPPIPPMDGQGDEIELKVHVSEEGDLLKHNCEEDAADDANRKVPNIANDG